MTRSLLPSRQILFVAIPTILIVGIVFILNSRPKDTKRPGGDFSEFTYSFESTHPDKDKDNLPDWEEDAWNTDPSNPDTDGDGMIDGDEVHTNRHPNVKGPGDTITESQKQAVYLTASKRGVNIPKTNKTQEVIDILLPQAFIAASDKISGTAITAANIEDVANPLADQLKSARYVPVYTEENILTSPNTLTPSMYVDTVLKTLIETSVPVTGDMSDLELLAESMDNQADSNSQKTLLRHKEVYEEIVEKLLALSVPEDYRDIHTQLINNYYILSLAVEDMTSLREDPLGVLLAVEAYREAEASNGTLFYFLGQIISST